MSIDYRVLDDPAWMVHDDRKSSYETECDGCGGPLPGYRLSIVTIITDRSGSEHAVTHVGDESCIERAVWGLNNDE